MAGAGKERFGADSTEPILGVVKAEKVGVFSGSVGLKNLVWHSPKGRIPGVQTDGLGGVTSVGGEAIPSYQGNFGPYALDDHANE